MINSTQPNSSTTISGHTAAVQTLLDPYQVPVPTPWPRATG
jgi:hypothetical protein